METPKTQLSSLEPLRSKHTQILAVAQWAHIVIIIGLGLYISSPNLTQALALSAAIALAGSVSLAMTGPDLSTRCVIAVGYCMQAATLTYLTSGHPWQIDMHMYFFAALAMSVAMFDVRATFAAAAAIALHHLILNFVAPAFVFPAGADLPRVFLHAVIVIAETGVLLYIIAQFNRVMNEAEAKSAEVNAAHARIAEEANIDVDAMDQLGQALSNFAGGDLTVRLRRWISRKISATAQRFQRIHRATGTRVVRSHSARRWYFQFGG